MMKRHIRILQMLTLFLLVNLIPLSGQAPESYIIAVWSFDDQRQDEPNKDLLADFNRQLEPATLTMLNGIVDEEGKSGITYIDNTCGVQFDPTLAIHWDAVEAETPENFDDDAQIRLTFSTVDWQNLALRFFYRTEDVEKFDVSYHLGDENWTLIADDVEISDSDEWSNIEVGLQEVDDIENRQKVILLIHDLTENFVEGELRIDNVAILGERISSKIDCPPTLQPLNPVQDVGIFLNSDNIPTFTGDDGFQFIVTDDKTAFDDLTILALTSDPNVINQLGLTPIDKNNGIFQLDIGAPHGYTGVAYITLQVSDSSGNVIEQVIQYGVSNVEMYDDVFYHQGTANASAGVAINDEYMVVANDNNQVIGVYNRNQSGMPVATLDVTELLELPIQNDDDSYPTVDIKGGAAIGNRQFWIGSHSHSEGGQRKFNRYRLFATETTGQGDNTELSYVGRYDSLFTDIDAWGIEYGFTFLQSFRMDIPSTDPNGFNIEAFSIAPDGQTAYIGMRTPLIQTEDQSLALIIPMQNFNTWFNNGNPIEPASFGDPIQLDLGGLGIRGMECNASGCLIIASAINDDREFALYTWSGNPDDAPIMQSTDLSDLKPESLVLSSGTNVASGSTIQLLSNDGNVDWYQAGGSTTLLSANLQFFRSALVTLD